MNKKLYLLAKGTSMLEKGYKGIFESLSKEKQSEFIVRKANFAKAAGILFVILFLWEKER